MKQSVVKLPIKAVYIDLCVVNLYIVIVIFLYYAKYSYPIIY